HAVLVRQLAIQHIRNDFHVAMAMGAEALARLHAVLVDDPQRAHAHVARVVIVGERERMPRTEPAMLGNAPLFTSSDGKHGNTSVCFDAYHSIGLQDKQVALGSVIIISILEQWAGAMPLTANDLILFAHVIEAGSFSQAAERTGLPKSTLSRRITQLENQLGERLLTRSTRKLPITDFGERILEHARRLLDEAEAAKSLALHRQVIPQGTLRASLPPEFHELSVVPLICEFRRS